MIGKGRLLAFAPQALSRVHLFMNPLLTLENWKFEISLIQIRINNFFSHNYGVMLPAVTNCLIVFISNLKLSEFFKYISTFD